MERVLLTHWRSPGDIVCMTACVRDLSLCYPGRFEIHIAGSSPALWENNPYIERVWCTKPPSELRRIRLSCRDQLLQCDGVKQHYLTAFHRDLQSRLGVGLPVRHPKGDLHLLESERATSPVVGRYWLIVAGGKVDMPAKIWSAVRFQQVVDSLQRKGINCVQGGAALPGHMHPRLRNVISFLGRTDLRGFLRLVYHADGVICPVTFAMHAAAVFDKPCVVIAGGRESWWWEAYVNSSLRHFGEHCTPVRVPHRFLHTIGRFDCCQEKGCWKTHVVADSWHPADRQCVLPVDDTNGQIIPRCLDEIDSSAIVEAVMSYYDSG